MQTDREKKIHSLFSHPKPKMANETQIKLLARNKGETISIKALGPNKSSGSIEEFKIKVPDNSNKITYHDIEGNVHHAKKDSFVIQTILFDHKIFTPLQAIIWLKDHGKATGLDIKDKIKSGEKPVIRARQVSPQKFIEGTIHTKEIEKGIKIVGGRLKV